MSLCRSIAVGGVLALAFAGTAQAADTISVPTSSRQNALPVSDTDTGFDWSGFYAGIFGSGQKEASGTGYGLGAVAGMNSQINFYLVGAEVAVEGLGGDSQNNAYAQVVGRGGIVVTDQVLLYGAAGYGSNFSAPTDNHMLLGGGVEFAVSDNVSLRGQYLYGRPLNGNDSVQQVTLGANFHF